MSPIARTEADAVKRRVYRLAFAVTFGLAFEVGRGAFLPVLAPVIALQLLAATVHPPPAKVLVLLLLAAAVSSVLAYFVAIVSVDVWIIYAISVGILYLWGFTLAFMPGVAKLFGVMTVTMTVVVTSLAAVSTGAALGIVVEFVGSILFGAFILYLAHAIFPHPPGARPPPAPPPPDAASRLSPVIRGVLATLVMLPLHLYLTSDGVAAMVILLTTATMLRQPGIAQSTRYCFIYAGGNALGGLLASFSALVLSIQGDPLTTIATTAAISLLMAWRFVAADRWAPLLLPGFVAYVVLFGLVLSPIPSDGVAVLQRVLQILVAAAYAFGAVSVLIPALRRMQRRETASA